MAAMNHALIFLLLLPLATAHLDAGEDRTVDGLLFDFGYSPERVRAETPATLSLELSREGVPLDGTVWMRVSDDEDVIFAGDLPLEGGVTSLSLMLPEGGDYDVTFRYDASEAAFAIDAVGEFPWEEIGLLVIGLAIGVLVMRMKKRTTRSR